MKSQTKAVSIENIWLLLQDPEFIYTHTHTRVHTHNSLVSHPQQIKLEALVSPISPCYVCALHISSLILTGCQSYSYFMKHGEWYDKSSLFHHFSMLEREMAFSFPSCSLTMNKAETSFFFLVYLRNFSHYLTRMSIW